MSLLRSLVKAAATVEGGAHPIAPLAADMPPGTPEEQRKTYNFAALELFLDIVAPL